MIQNTAELCNLVDAGPGSKITVPPPERGSRFNQGKAPLELIPAKAETEEAYVWAAGREKYGPWNWQKGMPVMEIIGCISRHLNALKRGETLDPETGRHHAAHIRCNAAMLIEFADRPELDDRPKKSTT